MRLVVSTRRSKLLRLGLIQYSAAHKVLWENAKILHRNISVGNLFMVDGPENQCLDFAGFLYDFDYGPMVELNPSAGGQGDLGIMDERNVKERTVSYTAQLAFNLVADDRYAT